MVAKFTENSSKIKIEESTPVIEKLNVQRPNIDNLIKRILSERREKRKKEFLIFSVFLILVLGLLYF